MRQVSRGDSPMDASPDTKTIYEDMTEKLAVTWAEGDEVGIFCETGEENASVASNYGYRTTAAGATSAFVPMDSYNQVITWADMTTAHDFYAYYPYSPAQEGSTVDRHKVPVSLPSVQTFDASDPLGHLSDIDFMYASAVDRTADGGMVTFDFSYLFSVLEVRLATSMYATVDAIELSCTEDAEAVAFEGATVDIETGALDMTGASVSSTIRLEGSQETSIGDYVSFFMLISPGHAGKTFDITAEIGGTPYTVVSGKAAPEAGFAAGKTYVIDAGLVDVAPADATPITDLSAGGTANCYYVTAANTLYSFDATVKGNGQALTLGEMSYSEDDLKIAPQSILVLWYTCLQSGIPWVQECPILMESVILSEGKAYFKTPDTFIPGNVVLIALDADLDYEDVTVDDLRQINNANVLWSWNLVVTEGYDPAAASNQYNKAMYDYVGSPDPKVIGGFNTTFSWKGLSLSAFFEYRAGCDVLILNEQSYMNSDGAEMTLNQMASSLNYWKKPGDNGVNPKPIAGNSTNSAAAVSSRWLEDGSYIRIKDVTLSYSLPQKALDKMRIKGLRFYVSGLNLYCFNDVNWWDPDLGPVGYGAGTYPLTNSFVGGIEVSF